MWGVVSGIAVDRDHPWSAFAEVRAGLRFSGRIAGPLWLSGVAEAGLLPYRASFEIENADGTRLASVEPLVVLGSFTLGPAIRLD
jgi:hypothetical protein